MTPEEHSELRRYRITGSRAADLMTGSYKVWNRLASELRQPPRVIGKRCGIAPLDWGIDHEPQVRAWVWERHPDWDIEPAPFQVYHDRSRTLLYEHTGCSPDGIIIPADSDKIGLECKAPWDPLVHLRYARTGRLPADYYAQVQFCLWVTGWDGWLFASGDPRCEDDEKYTETMVQPDPAYHMRIEDLATKFLEGFTAQEEFVPLRPTAANFHSMF